MFNALKYSMRGLLAALFLIPSFSQASFIFDHTSSTNSNDYEPTVQLACEEWFNGATRNGQHLEIDDGSVLNHLNLNVWSTSYKCKAVLDSVYYVQSNTTLYAYETVCPTGYIDNGSGTCIPEPICPTAGTTANFGVQLSLGGNTVNVDGDPFPIVDDGCVYQLTDPYSNDSCQLFDDPDNLEAEPTILCFNSYTSTGDEYTGDLSDTIQSADITNFQPHTPDEPSSTTTNTPPLVDNFPDGTSVTSETTSTNTDSGSDSTVEANDDSIVVTQQEGSQTSSTSTTTTTVNPDGSSTVSTNTENTYQPPQTTTTTIDKNDSQTTGSSTGGSQTTTNSNVTDTYDSDGNLTGTSTTGSGDGTGTDDSTKDGNCGAPGQPPCDVVVADNSDDYSDTLSDLSSLQSSLDTQNEDLVTELSDSNEDYGVSQITSFDPDAWVNKYSLFPASGACSGEISTTIFSKSFVLSPCQKLQPLRDILAWVFFILTFFTILKITFNRKIL